MANDSSAGPTKKRRPQDIPETAIITVRIERALFAADGKDHFIIRDKTGAIFADTTDQRIVKRSRWCFEEDMVQYWKAELKISPRSKTNHIYLLEKIDEDLKWEDIYE